MNARKLFLQINVSLDGYIEDLNGNIDWHFADDQFDTFILNTLQSIDGMVFGRVAFEKLAAYWPTAGETLSTETQREQARLMNELPKYVVSRTLEGSDWKNTHVTTVEEIVELKSQPGKDLALFAGATIATEFTKAGFVDEFRLIVNPLLQGGGTRLFTGTYKPAELSLTDVRRFASGALVLTYVPAGAPG
jgi:dihydrofolate reductase